MSRLFRAMRGAALAGSRFGHAAARNRGAVGALPPRRRIERRARLRDEPLVDRREHLATLAHARAEMHGPHAGGAHEIAERIDGEPRAREHRARRARGAPHHPRDDVARVEHRRMSARGQHRRDGRHAQQRIECGVQIARDVERAVEREIAPVGRVGDAPQRVEIDVAVRVEHPEHDAVRARRDGRAHVARDRREFARVVTERAAVRAHDHVDGNRHRGDDGFDHADARRQAALADRGHELDAIGPRARGGSRVADRRRDDFEKDRGSWHGSGPDRVEPASIVTDGASARLGRKHRRPKGPVRRGAGRRNGRRGLSGSYFSAFPATRDMRYAICDA
ncbi:hypothetical protein DM56_4476 [Burkholderia mallei]|nr:hypothetical protein DM75_3352 [Burkholderia mallei]KOS76044.1 hypothetical protein DM46_1957 [Burkholderia mallei]KOS81934.1 hypothetical protein DO61_4940 [Burkholderia mallei]KOS93102.1 hypothetical protein DM45_3106 [Burkholderia mallei]KOS96930.1 hypothetical protein DM49_3065 [Burkholderia mallei]